MAVAPRAAASASQISQMRAISASTGTKQQDNLAGRPDLPNPLADLVQIAGLIGPQPVFEFTKLRRIDRTGKVVLSENVQREHQIYFCSISSRSFLILT